MSLNTNKPAQPSLVILGTALWNLLVAIACIALSITIFRMDTLTILGKPTDLGKPVQYFSGLLILLSAAIALIGLVFILKRTNRGRYLSLIITVSGLALSLFALFGVWGFYDSFEHFVTGIMRAGPITLGFAAAYALYFISGRLSDGGVKAGLERLSLAISGLTLITILLLANILQGANFVLSTYSHWLTWLLTAIVALSVFLTLGLLKLGETFGERPEQRNAWQGWLMLAPNIIGFLFFFAAPLLLSFYLSFTNSSVGQVPEVVGFENYAKLLSVQFKQVDDPTINAQDTLDFGYAVVDEYKIGERRIVFGAKDRLFWISLGNTFLFCFLLLPLAIIPALGMSLILNSSLPGVHFFRALYFLPSVAAVVGTALIWRWLYTPTTGFINYTIERLTGWLGIADPDILWLSDPKVILFSVVVLAAWQVVGYNTVLFLAGLQSVPQSLYEASMIDGANPWQRFRNITLPLLAPTTFFVIITTMVTGLQVFNEPYALFPETPIPEQATTMVYHLYRQGFFHFSFGYASSIAWVLFLLIFTFTFIQFRANRSEAYG